jgi:pyrroloquinoline-quinone synthase
MNLKNKLDDIVSRKALLNHPFYQAWESGHLPVKALQAYAQEYGAFIELMPRGWEALGDSETAQEELHHAELWRQFAGALGTQMLEAKLPAVSRLVSKSSELFSKSNTALGALYAFEVQQPATAKSKLEGLQRHYNLSVEAEDYFKAHASNQHEAGKLLKMIAGISDEDREQVFLACAEMSQSLWDALTDIYQTHCPG